MFDVMNEAWNDDAANELSSTVQALGEISISNDQETHPDGIEYTPILIGSAV